MFYFLRDGRIVKRSDAGLSDWVVVWSRAATAAAGK
jgi:hypothetical protein